MCLVPDEAKSSYQVEGTGYDTYLRDAHRQVSCETAAVTTSWHHSQVFLQNLADAIGKTLKKRKITVLTKQRNYNYKSGEFPHSGTDKENTHIK